jgi:histone-lysine N-methyltransferase SETMAR
VQYPKKKLRRAIQNRRKGMLTGGVSLLHDNARPHTARVSQELLTSFGWDIVTHPPYSPDLAPSDYNFFTKLKKFLGGKRFSNDQEVEEVAERAGGGGL